MSTDEGTTSEAEKVSPERFYEALSESFNRAFGESDRSEWLEPRARWLWSLMPPDHSICAAIAHRALVAKPEGRAALAERDACIRRVLRVRRFSEILKALRIAAGLEPVEGSGWKWADE